MPLTTTKNYDPIKVLVRRKNRQFIVIVALMVLAIAGYAYAMAFLEQEFQRKSLSHYNLVNQIKELKFQFKVQVQEGKNTLLRHRDADRYQAYLAAFDQRHQTVDKLVDDLIEGLGDTHPLSQRLGVFKRVHQVFRQQRALAVSQAQPGSASFPYQVDSAIIGIDRAPTQLLIDIEQWLTDNTQGQIQSLDQQRTQAEIGLSLLLAVALAMLFLKMARINTASVNAAYRHPVSLAYNKKALLTALEKISSPSAALVLADIDNFKTVNEASGIDNADTILRSFASEMSRSNDWMTFNIASNFFIFLAAPNIDMAKFVGDVLKDIDEFANNCVFGALSFTTCEVLYEKAVDEPYQAFNRFSATMLEAKEVKRGKHHSHLTLHTNVKRRQAVMRAAQDIRQKIDKGHFCLFCQAIVPNSQKHSVHYEVLLRVKEGDQLVSPFTLLEAAETYGKSAIIDKFVFDEVVKFLKIAPKHIRLSINLSAESLKDTSFLAHLLLTLSTHYDLATRLTFEVTETAIIKNIDVATTFFRKVREAGSKVAIDDFGVGESSLRYLLDLPVDMVKIDGYFTKKLSHSKRTYSLVQAIVSIGQSLSFMTVAEYVEDKKLLQLATGLGIDYSQGYGLHIPEPITRLLEKEQHSA